MRVGHQRNFTGQPHLSVAIHASGALRRDDSDLQTIAMDLLTHSLYLRLSEAPRDVGHYAAGHRYLSNPTNRTNSTAECSLAEKIDADKSIPGILGMNLAAWLVCVCEKGV